MTSFMRVSTGQTATAGRPTHRAVRILALGRHCSSRSERAVRAAAWAGAAEGTGEVNVSPPQIHERWVLQDFGAKQGAESGESWGDRDHAAGQRGAMPTSSCCQAGQRQWATGSRRACEACGRELACAVARATFCSASLTSRRRRKLGPAHDAIPGRLRPRFKVSASVVISFRGRTLA